MLLDKILIDGEFGNRIKEVSIKKYHYGEWVNINNFTIKYNFQNLKWSNKVYNYMFNIISVPKCICGRELKFRGRINCIYPKFCSNKCSSLSMNDKRMETLKINNINKYGVENVFQLESVKEKIKTHFISNYGVDNPNKIRDVRDKIENTCISKYGVKTALILPESRKKMLEKSKENWNNKEWVNWFQSILIKNNGGAGFASNKIKDKYISFCLDKWGVSNSFASEEIKEKIKEHYITNYGVENPQQVEEIHNKTIKSSFFCKKYKDTDLYYQGTYELDFLNRYYDKIKIERSKLIKYKIGKDIKIYYPDFYLPDYDLVVEIKSTYYWNKHLTSNLAKMEHIKENKINFILVMDKDYREFEKTTKIF
jgi:hypothetical protein